MNKALDVLDEVSESYLQTQKLKEIYQGGGLKELRILLRTALHLADSILDETNKASPIPVSMEDKDRVKASKAFLDSALKKLRGTQEFRQELKQILKKDDQDKGVSSELQ